MPSDSRFEALYRIPGFKRRAPKRNALLLLLYLEMVLITVGAVLTML